jgi:hypothetical protein
MARNTDGSSVRTVGEMLQRTIGLEWLGQDVSLEEYCVALFFEENDIDYQYLEVYPGFTADEFRVDFQVYGMGFPLIIEVQGDHWHDGLARIALDRLRMIEILSVAEPGTMWVEVWGHDIVGGYSGFDPPTDRHFENVMEAALSGVQLGGPFQ